MARVLYISTFQFSGSTLLSFLLNTHSQLTSVGHTTGWNFGADEDYRCSCGEPLTSCTFYVAIANAYSENNLNFDIRNFGTAYSLSTNDRLNRILTSGIPFNQNSGLELLRDSLVKLVPFVANKFERCDRANVVFVRTALTYNDAKVFVDNSQDPYRFRHLSRVADLELRNLHLIRDPRGAVLSCRRNSGLDIELAMHLWLRRHSDIFRISGENGGALTVYYEDLCRDAAAALARIHEYVGVPFEDADGSFRDREHHILGNDMRLKASEIKLDTRWQKELSQQELETLSLHASNFMDKNRGHPLSEVLGHYFQ